MNPVERLLDLRAQKRQLDKEIVDAEREVIELAGNELPEAGSQRTLEMGDHRVTIKRPVTAKVSDDWWDIASELPDELQALVQVKSTLSVDKVGLSWIKENRPDALPLIAQAITETEGKTNVEVKA